MSEELSGPVTMYAKLPDGVQCDQCILQVSWSGTAVKMVAIMVAQCALVICYIA